MFIVVPEKISFLHIIEKLIEPQRRREHRGRLRQNDKPSGSSTPLWFLQDCQCIII